MYCLKNIDHARIPNDVIKHYLTLYPYIGRNKEMLMTVKSDAETLIEHNVRLNAYFFGQFLNLTISESRYRQILTKDVQAKSKDEKLLKALKQAFTKIHQDIDEFELIANEMYDLLKFLYKDIEPDSSLQFAKTEKKPNAPINLLASGHKTKREAFETLVSSFKHAQRQTDFEIGFIITNFFVDVVNLKPFVKHNEVVGLIMTYILLLNNGYECFHLSSFFEKLTKRSQAFYKHLKDASHNWGEGLADVTHLHRFFLEISLECYKEVSELLRNYTFDQTVNKGDYIENTINKLEEVFTKEDIRSEHPTISDSTINRTLKRMRDEKKIRPLGKGRSAKWMKLYPSEKRKSIYEQMNFKL